MPNRAVIQTDLAPDAIGPYSQAIKVNNTVYLSGQIALHPDTMALVSDDISTQVTQVFRNLAAVCEAANGSLNDLVKLNIYLCDLNHFAIVNDIMTTFFKAPYPARAVIGVKALPKDALVEMDAIMVI